MRHATRHEVAFDGATSASHPLTWAQKFQLGQRCTPHLDGLRNVNVRATWPLEGVPDVAAVTRAIGHVVARSESLRTRYPYVGAVYGEPIVTASGVVTVDEYATDTPHDGPALGDLAGQMAYAGFALDDQPMRFAVVTVGGVPTDLVLTNHHGAADAIGAEIVAQHVARLAADPDAKLRDAWQPREIAAWQNSDAGRAYARSADAHDRAALRDAPMPALAGPREDPAGIVYNIVNLKSRVMAPAIGLLTTRHGVTAAAVILGAYSRALAEYLGLDRCAINLVVANRQTPQTRESVAHLSGEALCAVDTSAGTEDDFGGLCRAAGVALLRGLRYGQRDPDLFTAALAEASATLGRSAANPYAVNIRRVAPRQLAEGRAAATGPDRIRELAAASEVHSFPGYGEVYSDTLTFDVWHVGETSSITLGTDSSTYDAGDLEAVLRRLEEIVCAAAVRG